MPCLPCQQARQQFAHGVRSGNVGQVAGAIVRAVAVNVDKLRGVDVAKRYGGGNPVGAPATPVTPAKPYVRRAK